MKIKKPVRSVGPRLRPAGLAQPWKRPVCRRGAERRAVTPWWARAWLASGLSEDEVFTSSTRALRGGGRTRWGNEILTAMAGRR
jgi:hypothetical protein